MCEGRAGFPRREIRLTTRFLNITFKNSHLWIHWSVFHRFLLCLISPSTFEEIFFITLPLRPMALPGPVLAQLLSPQAKPNLLNRYSRFWFLVVLIIVVYFSWINSWLVTTSLYFDLLTKWIIWFTSRILFHLILGPFFLLSFLIT